MALLADFDINDEAINFLNEVLLVSFLPDVTNGILSSDKNNLSGTITLFGVPNFNIVIQKNPDAQNKLKVSLSGPNNFYFGGIDWIQVSTFSLNASLPNDVNSKWQGTASFTSSILNCSLTGQLVRCSDVLYNSNDGNYGWSFTSGSLSSSLSVSTLLGDISNLNIEPFINSVAGFMGAIIQSATIILTPSKNYLQLSTPALNWSVFNGIALDSIICQLSAYPGVLSNEKELMLIGAISSKNVRACNISLAFHTEAGATYYLIDVAGINDNTLTIASVIGSDNLTALQNILPTNWYNNLTQCGLKEVALKYETDTQAIYLNGDADFLSVDSMVQIKYKPFFGEYLFNFSASVQSAVKVNLTSALTNFFGSTGIDLTGFPAFTVGVSRVGYDQFSGSFSVDGSFEIGNNNPVEVDGSIRVVFGDSKSFYASFYAISGISLDSCIAAFGTDFQLPGTGDLSLTSLDLSALISSKTYQLSTSLTGNLSVIPGLTLDEIDLSVFYENQRVRDVRFGAKFEISTGSSNNIVVKINAERSLSDELTTYWIFEGTAAIDQEISFQAVVNSLLTQFNIDSITLPRELQLSINVSKLHFAYNTSNSEFCFDLEFANGIDPGTVYSGLVTGDSTTANLCSGIALKTFKVNGQRTTHAEIKISPGLNISQLSGLSDSLPDKLKAVTLNNVSITVDIVNLTNASTKQYSLKSSFVNGDDAKASELVIKGLYSSFSTDGLVTSSCFGGNVYLQSGELFDFGISELDLSIKDLFIVSILIPQSLGPSKKVNFFGSDLSVHADIDLSSLPVVGDFLKEAKFSFDSLRIVYSNSDIKADELTDINAFLNTINVSPLVVSQSTVANGSSTPVPFPAGFSLQGSLVLGDNAEVIPLHSSFTNDSVTNAGTQPQLTAATAASPSTPSPVGKKFGPVSIKSVSLGLKNGGVDFTFTGGLMIGPLALDFIGLDVTTHVNAFDPSVSLQGFGLGINKPPLTLAGLLMESTINIPSTDSSGKPTTIPLMGYSGSLSIGYEEYALTAMGSYAKLPDGATTIFLYGFLGAPLGGLPVILYITGVAAGFGYNRAFSLPSPETINTYPLIQPVIPNNPAPVDFDAMNLYFMPEEGGFWGAIGIRVESFKMMESFVLLSVKFDTELEIDILGLTTMQFPVPDAGSQIPPLANILIGLVARILPERGVLAINGAFLPGSYIFVPEAKITGGFAMLSILKDQGDGQWAGGKEGDFIVTLGGYGPLYTPEPYYPQVPRLEMNWKVYDNLYIKADAYFAITPQAMMVGGHMVANYQAGGDFSIHVNFTVGADFIIYWKPYHYLGHMYADLDVTASIDVDCWLFTIHASVDFDLGADLKIWGPKFSGYASVHVHVLVSFTVGISFGDGETAPAPINWSDFSGGFLPADDKIVSCSIGKGLIASQSSASYNVVNAKELIFTCGSAIPVKSVTGVTGVTVSNTAFGIKPMANTSDDFKQSELNIVISKEGTPLSAQDISARFVFESLTKNMPAALWQPAAASGTIADNDGDSMVHGLLNGIRISTTTDLSSSSSGITDGEEDDINMAPSSFAATYSYLARGFKS